MTTIYDVAKYILEKMGPMSTWKLQKLCYYAQAWTLAWSGDKLFNEDFQAWANGPVCPALFQEHKGMFTIDSQQITKGNTSRLSSEQIENIEIIIADYGNKDAFWLREQTHQEDPWKNARGNLPEGASSDALITKDSMGVFYGGL